MASTLATYLSQVRALIHDNNSADFTDAQLTTFINNARNRVALDTHCVRLFLTGFNLIANQEQYPLTGFVGGVTVSSGGSGYSAASISFAGGGGVGATATATLSNGSIASVNMTGWGNSYTSQPSVNVSGAGTGAALIANVGINILDFQLMTAIWPGNQLAVTFEWMPFAMFQTFARAYRQLYSNPGAWTAQYGNQVFFVSPIPNQAYPLEIDAMVLPNPLIDNTTAEQIMPPFDDAVQLYAAYLAKASLQLYDQADYWYSGNPQKMGKYDIRIRELPATARMSRFYNPYRTFARRMRKM